MASFVVVLLGTHGLSQLGVNGNFFISIVLMLLYSWVIHKWLLPYGRNDVFLLLLLGLVLTMVVGTVTQFIQLKLILVNFLFSKALAMLRLIALNQKLYCMPA